MASRQDGASRQDWASRQEMALRQDVASRPDVAFMRKHTLTVVYESLQAHQYTIAKKKHKRQYRAQN